MADAPALRNAFSTKGHNGVKPCALCGSVIGKRWSVPTRCSFDETNPDRWGRVGDADLHWWADELQDAAENSSVAKLKKMEKARGLTYIN